MKKIKKFPYREKSRLIVFNEESLIRLLLKRTKLVSEISGHLNLMRKKEIIGLRGEVENDIL